MATAIFVQDGKALDYINNDRYNTVYYGDIVVIGSLVGVAECDIPVGGLGAVSISGVYEMPSDTGTAYAQGDALYWDASNKRVTKTSDSNTACGHAAAAKTSSAGRALVRIG